MTLTLELARLVTDEAGGERSATPGPFRRARFGPKATRAGVL